MKSRYRACAVGIVFAAVAGSSTAAQLYRYYNEQGVMEMSTSIPPEYAKNGYTVVNENGRILQVVPRQLSAAELARKRERDAQKAAAQQAAQARRRADAELLRMYSSVDDVANVRDRRLASLDEAIKAIRRDIQRLKTRKVNLQIRAAEA